MNLKWIAKSLARMYRFGGSIGYTVLDHTVIGTHTCAELGYSPNICKSFLCHDFSEGVMGFDCPSPIKRRCPDLVAIEQSVQNNLEQIYGFSHYPETKKVDYLMMYWEAHYLIKGGPSVNPEYWPKPEIEAPRYLHEMLQYMPKSKFINMKATFFKLCEKYGVKDA